MNKQKDNRSFNIYICRSKQNKTERQLQAAKTLGGENCL